MNPIVHKLCPLSRVERYKGLRQPRCNSGEGCYRCWEKYEKTKRRGLCGGIAHKQG